MTRLPVVKHLSTGGDRPPLPHLPRTRPRSPGGTSCGWLPGPIRPVSATAAAKVVGYTPAWGRAILKRYNARGPDALTDGRREQRDGPEADARPAGRVVRRRPGRPARRRAVERAEGGTFVKDRFGVEVWPQTGWQWLKDLGFRLVVPRPRHPRAATPEQQRVWL